MVPADDGASPAPIDRSVLGQMQSRFAASRMVETAAIVEKGNLHLHVALSDDYYPGDVSARLEIRWYRNDDFNIHYQAEQQDSTWQCRWNRHPTVHNPRDHFHPPPTAGRTDAEDAQWPRDHRNVCRLIFDAIEERIKTLWEQ